MSNNDQTQNDDLHSQIDRDKAKHVDLVETKELPIDGDRRRLFKSAGHWVW